MHEHAERTERGAARVPDRPAVPAPGNAVFRQAENDVGHDFADLPVIAPSPPGAVAGRLSAAELDLIAEGLNRGSSDDEIVEALRRRGLDDPPWPAPAVSRPGAADTEPGPEAERREVAAGLAGSFVRSALPAAKAAFDAAVSAEYAGLSPVAKPSFGVGGGEPFSAPLEKYKALRASYYRAGWTDPKTDLFDHIVPADLLGVPIVGGVHDRMVPLLAGMAQQLPPQTRAAFLAGTLGVGGFVPRFIGGTSRLSNHAFGLALDVDPRWNPHLKGEGDIAAIKRATGADLGKRLFEGSEPAAETQRRLDEIARLLQPWLTQWLPLYEPLVEAKRRARTARTAKERAEGKRTAANLQNDIDKNPASVDLRAVDTLVRNHGIDEVRAWTRGFATVDPDVIEVFRQVGTRYEARWGAEYAASKDVMHLELNPGLVLPNAAGRARPTDLHDVVPLSEPVVPPPRRRRRQ
jgi:hypothetical protein